MQTRYIAGLTASILAVGMAPMIAAPKPLTWHVSPTGNDARSGQRSRPLATLEAALATSRKHGGKPRRVLLAPGRYYVDRTVVLEARDEGLTIEGAGAGKTVVHGGRRITRWRKDGERFWAADMPEVRTGA